MQKPRVLVVEDEDAILELIEHILADNGYVVDTAMCGDSGMKKSSEGEYDLIVLDLMLPGMNGLDICRRLRSEGNSTPIMIVTARSSEESMLEGLAAGADEYLYKPFRVREFLSRAGILVNRRKEVTEQVETNLAILLRGGIAHHFNQPLTVLNTNLNLLDKITTENRDNPELQAMAKAAIWDCRQAVKKIITLLEVIKEMPGLKQETYPENSRIMSLSGAVEGN